MSASKIVSVQTVSGDAAPSNLSANLAVAIARAGHRVGVIDTGGRSAGLAALFGLDESRIDPAWNELIWGGAPGDGQPDSGANGTASAAARSAVVDLAMVREGSGEIAVLGPGVYLVPRSITASDFPIAVREGRAVDALKEGIQSVVRRLDLAYLVIDSHPDSSHDVVLPIALSDSLLIVLRPNQDDYQRTAVAVDLARQLGVPRILLVVDHLPGGFDDQQVHEQVEHTFNTVVAGVLPAVDDVGTTVGDGIFCRTHPAHPWTKAIEKIAAQIVS